MAVRASQQRADLFLGVSDFGQRVVSFRDRCCVSARNAHLARFWAFWVLPCCHVLCYCEFSFSLLLSLFRKCFFFFSVKLGFLGSGLEFGKWVCGFARIFILGVGNLWSLEVRNEQIKFSYSLKVVVFLVESWVFLGRSVGF